MQPFVRHRGVVAAMPRPNVDTDQIVPKQFLKGVERTGFGAALFHDWRYLADGSPDPAFELNQPSAKGATILVAGDNFGCGSSREHAVWALREYGFRAVIAPSFAEIFRANCCRNGVVPVQLTLAEVEQIFLRQRAAGTPYYLTVDLEAQRVEDGHGFLATFAFEPFRRDALLKGLDEIGRTLLEEARISAFEQRHAAGGPA